MTPPSPNGRDELRIEIGHIVAGAKYGDDDASEAAETVLALIDREREQAVREAIPIIMRIICDDPDITLERPDFDVHGKEIARKMWAALFPPLP